jgi:hypothetical protein
MKSSELAKILLEHPDFEVSATLCEYDDSKTGYGAFWYRKFTIELGDIGYSSKVINLDLTEE